MTDDIAEDDSEEVVENVAICSECDEYTEHQVLKEKAVGTGKDLLVKCIECEYVYNLQIREPLSIKIPFILTDGPNSKRVELDIDDDEVDEDGFYLLLNCLVRWIEVKYSG